MIEAVNSAAANAIVSRGAVTQTAPSAASAPSREGAPQAPQAPFVSPYISIDPNFDRAVLQIRNGETGEVIRQFPSEGRLQQQARDAARAESSARLQESSPVQGAAQAPQSFDVVSVQEVTAAAPSNQPATTPQNAINALSAGVQTAQTTQPAGTSVFA